MTKRSPVIKSVLFSISFFGLTFCLPDVQADSVNEKRVLRKAGGPAEGTLSQVVITTYPNGGGSPVVENSFDRTGSMKIPTRKGPRKSVVKHGGPDRTLDSVNSGKVKKAKVTRRGKKITYTGNGTQTPIFDDDPSFTGSAKAVSLVKGKKVKSTAKVSGSRTRGNGDVEVVSALAKGTSKY